MSSNNRTYQDTSWMFARAPAQLPTTPAIDTRILEAAHRPVRQEQISALLLAAVVIGGAVAVIGLILAGVIIYLAHDRAPFVWALLPLAILAGVITAAVLTIQWTHRAALRSWRLEDEDRYYRLREADELYQLRRNLPGAPARDTVRVELSQSNGQARQTQIADLQVKPDQLQRLAEGLLSGAPFAESAWTGAGRPFSRGQFAELRAVFIRRGWCEWRNPEAPAQGVTISPQGKAVLRSFASETSGGPPYQEIDDAETW